VQRALLSGIDLALGDGPRRWSDVVVVRNVGPLLTDAPIDGDVISNRGFNAVLCAAGGSPGHFLKLRPIRHRLFEREAAVTVLLGGHPATSGFVPPSRTFTVGPARVLAQEFVAGRSLDLLVRTRYRNNWQEAAAQVLRAAAPLWEGIAEIVEATGFGTSSMRIDTAALLADLDQLASQGVDVAAIGLLRARLESARLAPVPQHGDFWPRNVLVVGNGWRVLDFEGCGDVMLPLYDVLHFLRGCAESAGTGQIETSDPWLRAIGQSSALLDEFRRACRGLTADAIEAALIAYLVDFAARLHRRGIAPDRIDGRLRELEALPAALDAGAVRALLTRQ
jgi:hypothetical protein